MTNYDRSREEYAAKGIYLPTAARIAADERKAWLREYAEMLAEGAFRLSLGILFWATIVILATLEQL